MRYRDTEGAGTARKKKKARKGEKQKVRDANTERKKKERNRKEKAYRLGDAPPASGPSTASCSDMALVLPSLHKKKVEGETKEKKMSGLTRPVSLQFFNLLFSPFRQGLSLVTPQLHDRNTGNKMYTGR